MGQPSAFAKALYKKLNPVLGLNPKVTGYGDDAKKSEIDILSLADPTDDRVMFYCTLALSELAAHNGNHEILMAGYSSFESVPNILSTCTFFIINNKWESKLGGVFETLVEEYYPGKNVKHLLFTEAFLWDEKLEDFTMNEIPVSFLLAIPITQQELDFKNQYGFEALEDMFEENEINIFDLDRKSVV